VPAPKPKAKAVRSDSVKNRAAVLDAATAVFAQHGADASTEQIAARAGVGVGTVFRHFPTKNELLEAVLARMLEELAAFARARLDDKDAGDAFFRALERVVDAAHAKKAVADGLISAGVEIRRRAWAAGLREAVAALLARAQKKKAVRDDVTIDHVMALVAAASRAQDETVVAVIFDGLRRSR
jgi:AcrR family transcriptional regulator